MVLLKVVFEIIKFLFHLLFFAALTQMGFYNCWSYHSSSRLKDQAKSQVYIYKRQVENQAFYQLNMGYFQYALPGGIMFIPGQVGWDIVRLNLN